MAGVLRRNSPCPTHWRSILRASRSSYPRAGHGEAGFIADMPLDSRSCCEPILRRRTAEKTRLSGRQKEKPDREHQVDSHEHHALHPMALAVGSEATHDSDREHDRSNLKVREMEVHGLSNHVAEEDEDRRDK